jgi:3-methyladenine DNA glycosylase AlkD
MLDPKALAAETRAKLDPLGDPARREWSKTAIPTSMEVIGVKVPDLRPISKDLAASLKGADPALVLDTARHLVADGALDTRQIAYELLWFRRREVSPILGPKEILDLGRNIDNWVAVDTFAGHVAGPAWREGRIDDTLVHSWAASNDRWWRRAAAVCTVALNQKARGAKTTDPPRTLDLCLLLLPDRDDMVVKAISWSLRELAKREPAIVADFISTHDASLAPRVRREVRAKLETGRKP